MTTLYKPVLIESAEQAEALPEGTLATHPLLWAREKVEDLWQVEGETYESMRMVGFVALVPIEAEEGTDTVQTGAEHFYTRTRYVTPWEPV